jgi:L-serine dehydratase
MVVPRFDPLSLFDIIGPIMIGPSSSHTAGANRLARLAREFAIALMSADFEIKSVECQMHDSFRTTGQGHGSDRAIAAGLMGWKQDDDRLPKSLDENFLESLVQSNRIKMDEIEIEWKGFVWKDLEGREYHPNSVKFIFYNAQNDELFSVVGESWGGGNIQIREVNIAGNQINIEQNDIGRRNFIGKRNIYLIMSDGDGSSILSESLSNQTEQYQLFYLEAPSQKTAIVEVVEGREADFVQNIETTPNLTCLKVNAIFEAPKLEERLEKKDTPPHPDFLTLNDLIELGKSKSLWQIAVEYEESTQGVNANHIRKRMKEVLDVMMESIEKGVAVTESFTGYRERVASKLYVMLNAELLPLAKTTSAAGAYSVAVNELNAKMAGRIVAAPTAGSCGIIPGVLKALQDEGKYSEEKLINSLLTAALIGLIINNTVPTAGAQYGCQAETGVGSAMAAALAAQLLNGDAEQIVQAATLSLKNSLGLVCDPIGGKVEVPCIKRCGLKAVESLQAAVAALSGVESIVLPSEVVRAMKEIGERMDKIYKETAKGGLAITPSARR